MRRQAKMHDEGWLLSYADLITNLLLFFVLLLSAANISTGKLQQIAQGISGKSNPSSLAAIQEQLEQAIEAQALQPLLATQISARGLEISFNSGLLFPSGQATLLPEGHQALQAMAALLAPYAEHYAFAVEGHTDGTPMRAGSPFASNWELSTARAIAVRTMLIASALPDEKTHVEGYGATKPLPAANRQEHSPQAWLALHRRVIVRVY